jgi:hypothetical protein
MYSNGGAEESEAVLKNEFINRLVKVDTALGIEVFRGRLRNNNQLDLSDQPPGQYLMRIIAEGKVDLHKLLIQ